MARSARSVAATVVGWVAVLVVLWLLFGAVFATIRILVRFAAIVIVVGALLWLYFRLKGDPGD